jgi:signal transduction histidine kinase/CheY-like chemotaxis protein
LIRVPQLPRFGARWKLSLLLTGAISLSAVLFIVLSTLTLRSRIEDDLRLQATQSASGLAQTAVYGTFVQDEEILGEVCRQVLTSTGVESVGIFSPEGTSLMALGQGIRNVPRWFVEERLATGSDYLGSLGDPLVFARHTIVLAPGPEEDEDLAMGMEPTAAATRLLGIAVVSVDTRPRAELLHRWVRTSLLLSILLLGFGAGVSVLVAGWAMRPLRRLLMGTRAVAQGDLELEIPCTSRDEVGELTGSFNDMIQELRRSREDMADYSKSLEEAVDRRTRELREAQERLVQTEKMGALGQLVAGVAHDLNNPMTGVLGHAQLLRTTVQDQETRERLERIETEALRSKKIIENLLTFAQQRTLEGQQVGINGLIERTRDLLSVQLAAGISITLDLQPDLPVVMGDFHQLQQVFDNLVTNAGQAIRRTKGAGRIHITTRLEDGMVVVQVEDDGPGIPAEVRTKIFDPFFTTKPTGQGTGLGLSICFGILKKHEGQIVASRSDLGGACFTVTLPAAEEVEVKTGSPGERAAAATDEGAGEERSILVVDDEASICEILYDLLRGHQYDVHTALTLKEAKRKLARHDFDLILSDFRLPDGNAAALRDHLARDLPRYLERFVVMTGDTVSASTRDFLESTACPVLAKPFMLDEVLAFVRSALDEGSRAEALRSAGVN